MYFIVEVRNFMFIILLSNICTGSTKSTSVSTVKITVFVLSLYAFNGVHKKVTLQ